MLIAVHLPILIGLFVVEAAKKEGKDASCFIIVKLVGYPGIGPITNATPCCMDRLTTIVCHRLKEKSNAAFLHQCMSNPDFAFVQCCRTW